MQSFNLSDLLSPVLVEDFLKSQWPKEPLYIHPQIDKIQKLMEIPQLRSLESIVSARTLKVRACLPDFDDEYSSIHLEPQDALKAFRNNMTLVFDSMQKQDACIAEILESIRSDLGLPAGGEENDLCKARSIVYATPAGAGTRLHFDANVNFIIQLQGSKRWIFAPNTSVTNPTERFTVGALEMPAALEKQCHAMLIDEVPEGATEVLMQPGSVLFVPRGYWHATTTEEDSLSLNFTYSQPTWADIFTKSMQEHLLASSNWRELADGLESKNFNRREAAVSQFEVLLKSLALELPNFSAKTLLVESNLLKNATEP